MSTFTRLVNADVRLLICACVCACAWTTRASCAWKEAACAACDADCAASADTAAAMPLKKSEDSVVPFNATPPCASSNARAEMAPARPRQVLR